MVVLFEPIAGEVEQVGAEAVHLESRLANGRRDAHEEAMRHRWRLETTPFSMDFGA